MKKQLYIFLVLLLAISQISIAQENYSVEKSIYGVQAGFLGFWVHNEAKLKSNLSLRSEIGFDTGIFSSNADYSGTDVGVIFTPTISLEPRLYYNLKKRAGKGKNISKNSANFVSIRLNYRPDWFALSNVDNTTIADNIAIIPKWAIKRTHWSHFTYELGAGIGYRKYLLKQYGYQNNPGEIALDLHIRIGYTF